jgi:hypothetical protein
MTPSIACNKELSGKVVQIFEIKFCIDKTGLQFRNCTWNVNFPCSSLNDISDVYGAQAPYLIFSMHYYL